MENKKIVRLCRAASDSGMVWDYFEDDEIGSPDLRDTAPGTIALILEESIQDARVRHKSIALFVAYAARHSLACWFEYCDDDKPYKTIKKVINQVLSSDDPALWSIEADDLVTCYPTENGRPIIDCRSEDTLCASEAVSHAAKYVVSGSVNDAAMALSDAYGAFNVSPVGSIINFEDWLFDIALPAALEFRDLPPSDSSADNWQSRR